MTRLAAKSREPVRRVGLSATLGDMDAARRWLRPRDPTASACSRTRAKRRSSASDSPDTPSARHVLPIPMKTSDDPDDTR